MSNEQLAGELSDLRGTCSRMANRICELELLVASLRQAQYRGRKRAEGKLLNRIKRLFRYDRQLHGMSFEYDNDGLVAVRSW
jgi:hypothetical protein